MSNTPEPAATAAAAASSAPAEHSHAQPVILEVSDVVKKFGRFTAVDHVNMRVHKGEIVGLLGRNGAGKTTTFRMIMGMYRPDQGEIFFQGQNIGPLPMFRRARLGLGYLAQEPTVFSRLNVAENLLAVLELQPDLSAAERKAAVEKTLALMGLEALALAKAATLSGGERRRLEIGRALIIQPQVILLDEPFYGVDPIAVGELRSTIFQLAAQGIAILITDHDAGSVLKAADWTYIMSNHTIWLKGRSRDLAHNPEARRVYLGADFDVNFDEVNRERQKSGLQPQ
ncbi:MAG TPA: LPS export ABC transporter ATP-binding protein [Planctomycetota bacterium]|nr:LPS export ABC transporter ATP-binding protein [Planctomycetota bacterium]